MEGTIILHTQSASDSSVSVHSRTENEVIDKSSNPKEIVAEPKIGMVLASLEDLFEYYKQYSKQAGFGIRKRSLETAMDGETRYVVLGCEKGGKRKNKSAIPLKPILSKKTDCKARLRGTVHKEGYVTITVVELKHNHDLSTPLKVRLFRSNKKLGAHVKRRLEINDQAGISVAKNFNSFVVEGGGYEQLTFGEKECRNHIEKARKLRLGVGDASAIQKYFVRMQEKNSSFFYVMDFDDDSRLRNLFWADARCRAAYEAFGDVVSFDTTYLTNKYDMPFAPFVGVNHHGQSILFGCGLLSNEDIETFVWLFESWLTCMSWRAPKAIITDQCKAMQRAIEKVFPNTRHRWCLWHIMKKIPDKLRGYSQYEAIKTAMQNVVYDTLTRDGFEEDWGQMIEKFNLKDNEWLGVLYNERYRLVPIYLKDTFWAGMSTTQRSESMNAFFDGYVNSKTTLKQFVEQYDNALKSKAEKEKREDFNSFNRVYDCLTHYNIEKQFQKFYTNVKFKEVQQEFQRTVYCNVSLVNDDGTICTYKVRENVKLGDSWKQVLFDVYFNVVECEVQCMCHLFEFRGILCGHSLSVLNERQVTEVSPKYILARWRKDMKRQYTFVAKCNYSDLGDRPNEQRYDKLSKKFSEVVALAAETEEGCDLFMSGMDERNKKLLTNESLCGRNQVTLVTCVDENIEMIKGSTKVLSPLVVRRKGRPPSKRKLSKVDELRLKAQKKGKKQIQKKVDGGLQYEALPTSYTPHVVDEIRTQESFNLMAQPNCIFGSHSRVASTTSIQPEMVNQIGNQNQVVGTGFVNLLENFSQAGGQSSFWSSGNVGQHYFHPNMDN